MSTVDLPPWAIVSLRTVRLGALPSSLWVELATADGHVGLGETYGATESLEAMLHATIAPYILGTDARQIERHWWAIYGNWGPSGIGVEARAASAVDVALWDLAGHRSGRPIHELLGGSVRDSIRAYNTCGGPEYGWTATIPGADMRGVELSAGPTGGDRPGGRYEDLWAFHHAPGDLAIDLVAMGFGAMKIWPFDLAADATGGHGITDGQLDRGLEPFRRIRAAVGDRIGIALEMHGRWDLPTAIRIARAVEPFDPLWFEDPLPTDDVDALGDFARATHVPMLTGENLGPQHPFRPLLERGGVGIVSADVSYVGGVTALRRVADLAGLHGRPFNAHDCSGPVNLAAGVQVGLHARAAWLQEMVRAYYFGWYGEVATGLPAFDGGVLTPPDAPGHGVRLLPGVADRADAVVRASQVASGSA